MKKWMGAIVEHTVQLVILWTRVGNFLL